MLCKSAVKHAVKTVVIALTIPLFAGCVAEQRLAWSPDGKKLAVVGSDGVRISTDGGFHLGEPVEEDAQIVSWFSDSKRVVVVTKKPCENWADLEKNVEKEEVDGIKASAAQFLKQLENCRENYTICRDRLRKENFNSNYLSQALFYLRSTENERMTRLVGRDWRDFKISDATIPVSTVKVFAVEGNGALHLKQTIERTTDEFESAKVSPSSEFISLVDNDANLCLASTESGDKGVREIGCGFGKFPDWDVNADVIYGLHSVTKKEKTGEKNYQELVSIDARKPDSMKRLATLPTIANEKVRATVDGKLIYGSSATIKTGKTGKPRCVSTLNVMTLSSGKTKRVYQGLKGDRLENFEVSPDGKNISIPNSNSSIKVVSLKDGRTRLIRAGDPKSEKDVFTPVWKNSDEVCFENLSTANGESVVALYSLKGGKSKGLSKDWPIEAVTGLLGKPKEDQLTFEKMIENLKEQKNKSRLR
jgi:WD40 repeat protein